MAQSLDATNRIGAAANGPARSVLRAHGPRRLGRHRGHSSSQHLTVIKAPPEPARFISLRDVTDRERLQTQVYAARRMEQIGQLAGGMAHEVNNLLQVVLGDAALLQGQLQHDEDSRVLAIEIERVALRGGTLMRELLAYGRRTRLDLQPRDLAATVSAYPHKKPRIWSEP